MSGIYLQSTSNKHNKHSIYFRIRVPEGSFTVPTKISVLRNDWDAKRSSIRPTNSLSNHLNARIREIHNRVEEAKDLYRAKAITFLELKARCTGVLCSNPLETILKTYREEKGVRTVQAYETALNALRRCLGGNIGISDINYSTIHKALAYWKREELSPTTINTYVRHLVSLRNNAFKRNLVDSRIDKDRSFNQRVKELEIRSITKEQFRNAVLNAKTKTEIDALKLYLLSFISRGLYFGDFKTLNPTSGVFTHYRQKTGNRMLIDGLDGLILTLYDSIDMSELKHSRLRKYQTALTKILGAAHKTARKTFDSYALLLGVDFQIRLHLLGQRDRSIKRHYTNFEMKAIQNSVNDAHRKVVNHFGAYELAEDLLNSPLL